MIRQFFSSIYNPSQRSYTDNRRAIFNKLILSWLSSITNFLSCPPNHRNEKAIRKPSSLTVSSPSPVVQSGFSRWQGRGSSSSRWSEFVCLPRQFPKLHYRSYNRDSTCNRTYDWGPLRSKRKRSAAWGGRWLLALL